MSTQSALLLFRTGRLLLPQPLVRRAFFRKQGHVHRTRQLHQVRKVYQLVVHARQLRGRKQIGQKGGPPKWPVSWGLNSSSSYCAV